MDIFNSDFWKQQWEAFVTAPFIMLPPIAIAAWAGWWLKGTVSEGTIASLKGRLELAKDRKSADEFEGKIAVLKLQIALFENRLKLADEKVELADKTRAEVERQFKAFKDEVAADVGSSHAAQAAKVDAAIADFSVANNAVSSAVSLVKSEDYFRGVLKNMDRCAKDAAVPKEKVFVRFGTVGKGVHPNYQVETPNGTTRFAGVNHERFHDEPNLSFNKANLSERFGFGNIQAMLRLKK
jgi:hypothetical protein